MAGRFARAASIVVLAAGCLGPALGCVGESRRSAEVPPRSISVAALLDSGSARNVKVAGVVVGDEMTPAGGRRLVLTESPAASAQLVVVVSADEFPPGAPSSLVGRQVLAVGDFAEDALRAKQLILRAETGPPGSTP